MNHKETQPKDSNPTDEEVHIKDRDNHHVKNMPITELSSEELQQVIVNAIFRSESHT